MKQKLVLLHGWNYKNYSKFKCTDAWHNRQQFIKGLADQFEIIKFNLPGFCGESDPMSPWSLNEYADFVQSNVANESDFILLGYSFGAAVAVVWKQKYKKSTNLILVSPALKRKYKRTISSPFQVPEWMRFFYLFLRGNKFYILATKTMRETYQRIVSVDLSTKLLTFNPEEITLIFGEKDTMTPYTELDPILPESFKKKVRILKGGGHDIANTHTEELLNSIREVVKAK